MQTLITCLKDADIPLPNEGAERVRRWLSEFIPLSACAEFVDSITDVTVFVPPHAPEWLREIATNTASSRPRPLDVQMAMYSACITLPLHRAFEAIFEQRLDIPDDPRDRTAFRFSKYVNNHFTWRFERDATASIHFRTDAAANAAHIAQVRFSVVTDPVLFANLAVERSAQEAD